MMKVSKNYITRKQLVSMGLSEYMVKKIIVSCQKETIRRGGISIRGKIPAEIFTELYPQFKIGEDKNDE